MQIDSYLLKNFYDCSEKELTEILSWRNREDIRNNYFTSAVIELDDHLKYVASLKKRENVAYFLVFSKDTPIGVISFTDINKISAEVGYYKSDKVANIKGVGVTLLNIATKTAKFIWKGTLETLITEVFSFNIASIKSIERAGYKENKSKNYSFLRGEENINVLYYELHLEQS